MKMSRTEQKEYDRCRKRFIYYGFDKREQFTEEWLKIKADENARAEVRRCLEEDGIIRVSCPRCASSVYLNEYDIQRIREGRNKIHDFCEYCPKNEIARSAHLDTPYKNRLYDNMGIVHLEMVGTGERRWQKGISEASRPTYDIPDEYKYDRRNKDLVEYVARRAKEELALVESRYNIAPDDKKRWMCSELAPYIWILDGEISVDFHNCIRIYIGLSAETEKSYGLVINNKLCTIVTPPDEPDLTPIETIQSVSIKESTQVPTAAELDKVPKSLKDYFNSKGLTCVDKRPSGGCLWVVGSEDEIKKYIDEACVLFDISGVFCSGGKATKNKHSWYTKSNK